MVDGGLVRHARSWRGYWRGISSATNDPRDPKASAWRGFWRWVRGGVYRGYATEDDGTPYEDDYYVCPWVWDATTWGFKLARLLGSDEVELEAHEAGHLRRFGNQFPYHPGRVPDGGPWPNAANGLDHEPPATHDLMVDGLHFWMRTRDERWIRRTFLEWVALGRVRTLLDG